MLKPVLGGVGGNLQFTLPSMNRFNQTGSTIFAILLFWAFLGGYDLFFPVFLLYMYLILNYSTEIANTALCAN